MNVPKTPDHKLIEALRIRAKDAPPANTLRRYTSPAAIVTVALLHEVADRLAELTQPQPIETAPRDGTKVRAFGTTLNWNRKRLPYDRTLAYKEGDWVDPYRLDEEIPPPTHWLPCVQVDMDALEGKGDGQ